MTKSSGIEVAGAAALLASMAWGVPSWAGAAIVGVVLCAAALAGRLRLTLLTLGTAVLALVGWSSWDGARWVEREGARYVELLDRHARVADTLAARFDGAEGWPTIEVFERLQAFQEESGTRDLALILYDDRRRAFAWAGPGLQHELGAPNAPAFVSQSSFTATSLGAVRATASGSRVLVGSSFSTLGPPFSRAPLPVRLGSQWTLAQRGGERTPEAGPAWTVLAPDPEAPELRLRSESLRSDRPIRLAWGLAALGSVLLLCGTLVLQSASAGGLAIVASGALFAASLGAALDLSGRQSGLLVLAALALSTAFCGPGFVVASPVLRAVVGGLAVVAFDLSLRFVLDAVPAGGLFEPEPLVISFSVLAIGVALLGAVRSSLPPLSSRWAWAAMALATLGCFWFEAPFAVAASSVVAGACLGAWAGGERRTGELAGFALVATLLVSAVVETRIHRAARADLDRRLESLTAPDAAALDRLQADVARFFDGIDLLDFGLAPPGELAPHDLAYALWSASPLSRQEGYSAVLVTSIGGTSSFSLGLPLNPGEGELDPASVSWPSAAMQPWLESSLRTELLPLYEGDRAWGEVVYWFAPAVAGLSSPEGSTSVEAALLRGVVERGGSVSEGHIRLLPGRTVEEVGGVEGRWTPRDATDGDGAVLERVRALEYGGALLARAEIERLGPVAVARRVGARAIPALVLVAALVALALVVGLTSRAVRGALAEWLGPYSKRMVVLFALLLILPLSSVNLLLLRSVGQRLESERLSRGEAAMRSAQAVLADVLVNDDPGFSVDSYVTDELLLWLARVVQHEVSLYFRGAVMASSRPELFAANLLPAQIPGEIFADITLRGERIASRESSVGDDSYRELYASLDLPGTEPGASELILSVPLLAQQEQATLELRQLATQSLLASVSLLALVVVVGAALARRFTQPITQMARGTERIASGATSLGLDPKEPELAVLAQAIDRMAARIAEGRSQLVREKQFVEGVVENITSAVLSISEAGHVLMLNRAARDLLEIEVGDHVDELLERDLPQDLEDLVRRRPAELERVTASFLQGDEEHDWTIVWVPVPGEGDPEALLVVEEVSDVLKGQRLAAWAEMARMIAHEIKNPLTPIRLSAEHLQRVWDTRPDEVGRVLERCIGNILEQVDELQQTASDFSAYSRIPQALFEDQDFVAAMQEVVDAYRLSPPPGLRVLFEPAMTELELRFDVRLLSRALRNLIENAIRASESRGEVSIVIDRKGDDLSLLVRDRGPGVSSENLRRIFEPYFSTSTGGTGLGLPIVRQVVEQHGGEVSASNRRDGGLEVRIVLPIGPGSLMGGATGAPSLKEGPEADDDRVAL